MVSKGEGTIKIKLKRNNNDYNSITSRNVLYGPTVSSNIISVKQLTKRVTKLIFVKMYGNKDGETVFIAKGVSSLYVCKIEERLNVSSICIHYWQSFTTAVYRCY